MSRPACRGPDRRVDAWPAHPATGGGPAPRPGPGPPALPALPARPPRRIERGVPLTAAACPHEALLGILALLRAACGSGVRLLRVDGPVPADRTIGLGGRPQPVPDRTTGRGSPEQVRPTIEHGMGESGVLAVISRTVFGFLPSRRLRLPLVKRQPRQPGQSRRLFIQLVRVPLSSAGATRRRVPHAELSEHQWQIAQRLATTRMLVIDGSQARRPLNWPTKR